MSRRKSNNEEEEELSGGGVPLFQPVAPARAIPVKVAAKRPPVFPFSGFDLYHHF